MSPHVTCIILNYNEWGMTQNCIDTIASQNHKNLTVLLIDNNSQEYPDSLNFSNKSYPLFNFLYENGSFKGPQLSKNHTFVTIKSNYNGGFPYGVNIGLKYIKQFLTTSYIWLLNNDTLCEPDTLSELLKYSSNSTIVGSQLQDLDGNSLRSYNYIHPIFGTSHNCSPDSQHTLKYIPFTSALIPIEIIHSIGELNSKFFLYYDDADFCIRAKSNNVALKLASQSIVYHNESYSSTKKENSSLCPDWLPIYSKKQFMTEHNFAPTFIYLSLFISLFKRLISGRFLQAFDICLLIINPKRLTKRHHFWTLNRS